MRTSRAVSRMVGFATNAEILKSKSAHHPNTLFLSVGSQCNLDCIYCYTVPKILRPDRLPLSGKEQERLLKEASLLGVRYLVIPGPGEPLMYGGLKSLVSEATRLGMHTTVITNGTCITRALAKYYKNQPVSFMVKLNSFDRKLQDHLIGRTDMADKIYRAINILIEAGFTGYPETRLAIDALICKQTIDEIPDLVRFALEKNIHPVVERLLPLGAGLINRNSLEVDEAASARVLWEVQNLIGEREGNAFSGQVCDLHDYTLFMDVDGMATKCVGGQREILLGDWRRGSLSHIWERQIDMLHQDTLTHTDSPSCSQSAKCPGRIYCETKYVLRN